MNITYLGHSCFKIESQGYEIVLNPYQDGKVPGYLPIRETADAVLCSHGHGDHCGAECVTLREGGRSPFTVETIHTWHDSQQGALRGPDTVHILDDGRCRAAHLGDLGCELTPEQKEKLHGLAALLIPVGGHYTIGAIQANRLASELDPAVVIPMHYRGGGLRLRRDRDAGAVYRSAQGCGGISRLYPGAEARDGQADRRAEAPERVTGGGCQPRLRWITSRTWASSSAGICPGAELCPMVPKVAQEPNISPTSRLTVPIPPMDMVRRGRSA